MFEIFKRTTPSKNYPPRKENNSPPGEILEKKTSTQKCPLVGGYVIGNPRGLHLTSRSKALKLGANRLMRPPPSLETKTFAPEKKPGPKRKHQSSNHPFSGAKMLVSKRVLNDTEISMIIKWRDEIVQVVLGDMILKWMTIIIVTMLIVTILHIQHIYI